MKRGVLHDLSIGQSILAATLSIVMIVLLLTSLIYYTAFSRRTDALVESQSREINKQIVLNYRSYISSVIETANYVQSASLNLDVVNSYKELQDIYSFSTDIKKDVVSIFLFDSKGEKILGNDMISRGNFSISNEHWFLNALSETTIFHFSAPHTDSVYENGGEQVISVSRHVTFSRNGSKQDGVLLIELNFNSISDLASKTNLGEGGHILILNDNDSLIYYFSEDGDSYIAGSYELAIDKMMGGYKALINGKEMYFNINTLAQTRWRIVTAYNIDEIAQAKTRILYMLFIIFLGSFFLTAVVASLLSYRISRPLNQLEKSMLRIENGDFHTKVAVTGQKELVLVGASFNSMMDEIRLLMDKVVTEQREKRKTELKALQNQINPHFLYNTLDSIVWLAENERSEDVITTVVALARFFRISISKGKNFIPVRDEIDHIKNYLTIQKIRYVDKFEYQFKVDENIRDLLVMKLILQPLVENAIYHGVGDEKGIISISGYRTSDFLIFEVMNSGYGITDEGIQEIYRVLEGGIGDTGVGLKNVYQRLKIYYGDSADIRISSELDEWTKVTILIPLIPVKGSEK